MRHRKLYLGLAAFAAAVGTALPVYAQDTSAEDAAGGMAAIFSLCCSGIATILSIALLVLWVWMLIDAIQRQESEYPGQNKTLWIIMLVVFGYLAAIIYYFAVYKKRKRGSGSSSGTGMPPAPPAPPMAPPAPPMAPPAPPMAPPAPPAG
jgi:hypothetical protein